MDKPKQKKGIYNDDIIKVLKNRYGFTRDYILKSIRGDRVGIIPTQIQEEYKKLNTEAKKIINQKSKEL